MAETSLSQIADHTLFKLAQCLSREIRRQLFRADLKKKSCRHVSDRSANDCIGSRFATFN